ncbi:MAG: 50S ribosomal protein L13 [Myxococcales bacterium]|nr:50S ribosomal protein L13 [Myxococcales bacterium]
MKTFSAKPGQVERGWYIVDLDGKVLGRAASEIAKILRGKHKPTFTPHEDVGDFVIAINAEKIKLTGQKVEDKLYHHHTGYPGGLKTVNAKRLLENKPEEIIKHAVRGMLPKNTMGRNLLKKLKVYSGAEHPHGAQKPVQLDF